MPRASSLGAELSRELAIEPELIPGDRGIFDVAVDGAVVFSKYKEDRFPHQGGIVNALKQRLPHRP